VQTHNCRLQQKYPSDLETEDPSSLQDLCLLETESCINITHHNKHWIVQYKKYLYTYTGMQLDLITAMRGRCVCYFVSLHRSTTMGFFICKYSSIMINQRVANCIVLHLPNLDVLREVKCISLACVHGELCTVIVKHRD
jgi:hypothetical protein